MKNYEKFKTVEACNAAHKDWCDKHRGGTDCQNGDSLNECLACQLKWMFLEAEEEKPMPCPFCGKECSSSVCRADNCGVVACNYCGYRSAHTATERGAIINHNRVCRAVNAAKKREGL